MSDGLISDELTVGEGQGLQTWTVSRQLGDGVVGELDTLLQVHPLQLVAGPGQGNEACISQQTDSSTLQCHKVKTVVGHIHLHNNNNSQLNSDQIIEVSLTKLWSVR